MSAPVPPHEHLIGPAPTFSPSDAEKAISREVSVSAPDARLAEAQTLLRQMVAEAQDLQRAAGGFAEWQTRQETLAQTRELAAEAEDITAATEGRLTDHLATVLAAPIDSQKPQFNRRRAARRPAPGAAAPVRAGRRKASTRGPAPPASFSSRPFAAR